MLLCELFEGKIKKGVESHENPVSTRNPVAKAEKNTLRKAGPHKAKKGAKPKHKPNYMGDVEK